MDSNQNNQPESAESGIKETHAEHTHTAHKPEQVEEKKPSIFSKIKLPSFKKKVQPIEGKPSIFTKLKNKLSEFARVIKIAKKPTKEEYIAIAKASAIGILVVGAVGFVIHMIVQLIQMVAG